MDNHVPKTLSTDEIALIFEAISNEECVCSLSLEKNFHNILFNALRCSGNTDDHLLFVEVLRQCAEIYNRSYSQNLMVCKGIYNVLEIFLEENIFLNLVNFFVSEKDKYIHFTLMKALKEIIKCSPEQMFKDRLTHILQHVIYEENMYISSSCLRFFICLLEQQTKNVLQVHSSCSNKVSSRQQVLDINAIVCCELSKHWNELVANYLNPGNQNICDFLQLWISLNDQHLNKELSDVFLCDSLTLEFFKHATKLPHVALKFYVDIISQIFSSRLHLHPWKCSERLNIEECMQTAISDGFLESTCLSSGTFYSFVGSSPIHTREHDWKFDATSKKILFIVFSFLAEFQNSSALLDVLEKVFSFFSISNGIQKPDGDCSWICDIFIEEDDLLFGVMFASLKIYYNYSFGGKEFRSANHISSPPIIENQLNPHKSFLVLLQQIGNDHNELLSFLVSDETCCLSYLLKYLKLIVCEWDAFLKAHHIFIAKGVAKRPVSLQTPSALDSQSPSAFPFDPSQSSVTANTLVSYSSSSEEESSSDSECAASDLRALVFRSVSVLVRLKEAIAKLVEKKEFPYNASPLIVLLKACENKLPEVT